MLVGMIKGDFNVRKRLLSHEISSFQFIKFIKFKTLVFLELFISSYKCYSINQPYL